MSVKSKLKIWFFRLTENGGGEGIRTPGRSFLLQRFSKPPPSATRPPLRRGHEITHKNYRDSSCLKVHGVCCLLPSFDCTYCQITKSTPPCSEESQPTFNSKNGHVFIIKCACFLSSRPIGCLIRLQPESPARRHNLTTLQACSAEFGSPCPDLPARQIASSPGRQKNQTACPCHL